MLRESGLGGFDSDSCEESDVENSQREADNHGKCLDPGRVKVDKRLKIGLTKLMRREIWIRQLWHKFTHLLRVRNAKM